MGRIKPSTIDVLKSSGIAPRLSLPRDGVDRTGDLVQHEQKRATVARDAGGGGWLAERLQFLNARRVCRRRHLPKRAAKHLEDQVPLILGTCRVKRRLKLGEERIRKRAADPAPCGPADDPIEHADPVERFLAAQVDVLEQSARESGGLKAEADEPGLADIGLSAHEDDVGRRRRSGGPEVHVHRFPEFVAVSFSIDEVPIFLKSPVAFDRNPPVRRDEGDGNHLFGQDAEAQVRYRPVPLTRRIIALQDVGIAACVSESEVDAPAFEKRLVQRPGQPAGCFAPDRAMHAQDCTAADLVQEHVGYGTRIDVPGCAHGVTGVQEDECGRLCVEVGDHVARRPLQISVAPQARIEKYEVGNAVITQLSVADEVQDVGLEISVSRA